MRKVILSLFCILLFSCSNSLQEVEIYSSNNKLIQKYYLNSNSQKDSIETVFRKNGRLAKKIYWDSGFIDSVVNYNIKEIFSYYEILQDSVLLGFNRSQELVSKARVNKFGDYDGIRIVYKDSVIQDIISYANGKYEGVLLTFFENRNPKNLRFVRNNYPIHNISFYENGHVKSIGINITHHNKDFGVSFDYYKNGKLKGKSESYNGNTNGTRYKYDSEWNLISENKFNSEQIK